MPIFISDRVERLDHLLARSLPDFSRSRLAEEIRAGRVLVEGKPAKPSLKLEPGWTVELEEPAQRPVHDLEPAIIPLRVVYEDEAMLVVDKPRGLATHPAKSLEEPTLVNALLARQQSLSRGSAPYRPGIVHRLDKDTTGLIIVAKTDAAHAALARSIERKEVERRYLAAVAREVVHEDFTIDAPLARDPNNRLRMAVVRGGRSAVTHVRRLARLDRGSLVRCRLTTGRTHQIRVHLLSVGHPVLGDPIYAPKEFASGPMQLHAAWLGLEHPVTHERMALFAPPPADFVPLPLSVEELEDLMAR